MNTFIKKYKLSIFFVVALVIMFSVALVSRVYAIGNTHSINLVAPSSQYLSTNDSASLSVTGDISVEGWVKLNSLPIGTAYTVASKLDNDSNRSWVLSIADQGSGIIRLCFGVFQDGVDNSNQAVTCGTSTEFSSPSKVGAWVHVAATWNAGIGNYPKLYINGVEEGSYELISANAASIYDNDAKTGVGARDFDSPTSFFDGKIDEVRIWNVALSASAIAGDYNQELVGNEPGLVAYWKLNNDAGVDSTVNGNNVTAVNSPTYVTDTPFFTDTTPPTVSVTSPTDGSTASGTISLAANANDNVGIAGVQFILDGSNFGAEDISSPYSVSLDTTTLTNAIHSVTAQARDTSGNLATSTAVNFTVNNVAPFVPVLKARQGTQISGTGTQLRNDTQMTLELDAGKTYIIDGAIFASATGATPDIKIAFLTPTGATMDIGYDETNINGTLSISGVASVALPLPANIPRAIQVSGTITTTSSGAFILQWGQNASSTQITTVRAGGYLRADEI